MKALKRIHLRPLMGGVLFALLLVLLHRPVAALSPADVLVPVTDAAMKVVQFCVEPEVGLDKQAVATLVDYVLSSKQSREYALPKSMESTGAYYEFDTKIAFPRFLEYSYSPLIPAVITRPSSLRYSYWATPRGEIQRLPNSWKPVPPGGDPVIVHSMQHESDTPDLNSGVYHEYELKRTLILLNQKGHQVMVSVSKQTGTSAAGKKGVIIGNDEDWNYYYSGQPGTPKTGLGWVKSYIYDYFSIGVYAESATAPPMVKTGVFQWLRAGWSGINFVKSSHILRGLKRYARDTNMILEFPRLPSPEQMISTCQSLSNMPAGDLTKKYAALRQAQRSSAIQSGKISKSTGEEEVSSTNTPKEQMVEELMLEYLKTAIGKDSKGIL
jgi:hypothetical protein